LQTVLPAVVAHREGVDGSAVEVQAPDFAEAEKEYVLMTQRESDTAMAAVRTRVLALLASWRNRLAYRKRTTIAVELVRELEAEGHCPAAQYACDTGVCTRELTQVIEKAGTHGVSELESARHINWAGQGRRVDAVASELRTQHPERCRALTVTGRNGQERVDWACTKVVR
jgi:hypothetical protein